MEAVSRMINAGASNKVPRFLDIDAVVYISEKHCSILSDGRQAFAMGIFSGAGCEKDSWKMQLVDRVVRSWSLARTGTEYVESDSSGLRGGFDVIEDIPEKVSRSELWIIEYARHRHLEFISNSKLKIQFNRLNVELGRAFIRGNWDRPHDAEIQENIRAFTHVMEEIKLRGIDVREFTWRSMSLEERSEIFRPGMPRELVEMFSR